jgi:NAD(P)H-nitrite reductase large subunit
MLSLHLPVKRGIFTNITKNTFMEDQEICHCNNVYRTEILNAIREHGFLTVNEIQDALDAGTICGRCISDIHEIIDSAGR